MDSTRDPADAEGVPRARSVRSVGSVGTVHKQAEGLWRSTGLRWANRLRVVGAGCHALSSETILDEAGPKAGGASHVY